MAKNSFFILIFNGQNLQKIKDFWTLLLDQSGAVELGLKVSVHKIGAKFGASSYFQQWVELETCSIFLRSDPSLCIIHSNVCKVTTILSIPGPRNTQTRNRWLFVIGCVMQILCNIFVTVLLLCAIKLSSGKNFYAGCMYNICKCREYPMIMSAYM